MTIALNRKLHLMWDQIAVSYLIPIYRCLISSHGLTITLSNNICNSTWPTAIERRWRIRLLRLRNRIKLIDNIINTQLYSSSPGCPLSVVMCDLSVVQFRNCGLGASHNYWGLISPAESSCLIVQIRRTTFRLSRQCGHHADAFRCTAHEVNHQD